MTIKVENEDGVAVLNNSNDDVGEMTIEQGSGGNLQIIGKQRGIRNRKGILTVHSGSIEANNFGITNEYIAEITGGTITATNIGINTPGILTITGGTITGGECGIFNINSGNLVRTNEYQGTVTITGGTITGGDTGITNTINTGTSVAENCWGQITITGGTITGNNYGIGSKAGKLKMTGGTVKGIGHESESASNENSRGSGFGIKGGNVEIEKGSVEGKMAGIDVGGGKITIGSLDCPQDTNGSKCYSSWPNVEGKNSYAIRERNFADADTGVFSIKWLSGKLYAYTELKASGEARDWIHLFSGHNVTLRSGCIQQAHSSKTFITLKQQ